MSRDDSAGLVEPLTQRERDVLQLLAQGKSNREMAEALVLSVHTVKWYNGQIYGKLGVANREEAVARARALRLVTGTEMADGLAKSLALAATPLVGREEELRELEQLVLHDNARLISIVGPGGIGKTRLAVELARNLATSFADGAAFASLAPLQSWEGIVPALARALDFKPIADRGERRSERQQLLDYLQDKALMLVLDNFEHLLAGVPLLVEILAVAPRAKLLVTSRERLQLQVERVVPIQGLPFSEWTSVEQARRDPALRLFLQRGQQVRPDFALRGADLDPLQRILRSVEGMPLAIILAAAWLELFSPAQIAAELERSLDFLEAEFHDLPPRQRSMRAVFDSAWARLSEGDRALFAALSVFRGGFSLAAVQAVAGAEPRALRRLAGRSMLGRGDAGRFEVHELLRQYASEQLASSRSREQEVRDRHRAYFLAFLGERETALRGARAEAAMLEIEADVQNCYAAWARAVQQKAFAALGSAAMSLATYCLRAGRYEEGLAAFDGALASLRQRASSSSAADPALVIIMVRLLASQCALNHIVGAFEQAEAVGKEALSLLERRELEEVDTRWERGLALLRLSDVYLWQDRASEARPMLHECLALFDAVGDSWHKAVALQFLADTANRVAAFHKAVSYSRQAVQLFAASGDRYQKTMAQVTLGYSLDFAGQVEEAEKKLRDSIAAFEEMERPTGVAVAMLCLAETFAYRGRFEEARALAAGSVALQERLGRRYFATVSNIRWCLSVLHLGEYEAVLAQIPGMLEVARANKARMNAGRAWFLSGCAWLALGRTRRACEELEEAADGLRQIESWDYLVEALAALSCAYTERGQLAAAREALLEAVEIALEMELPMYFSFVLAPFAYLLLATEKSTQAVDYYVLASTDPYIARSRWWEDVIGRHMAAAANALPEERRGAVKVQDLRASTLEALQALKAMQ